MWRLLIAALVGIGCTNECSQPAPNVTLRVVDSAAQPLGANFTWLSGKTPQLYCTTPGDAGTCAVAQFRIVGADTVTVSRNGYQSQLLAIDGGVFHDSACGDSPARAVDKTVTLVK